MTIRKRLNLGLFRENDFFLEKVDFSIFVVELFGHFEPILRQKKSQKTKNFAVPFFRLVMKNTPAIFHFSTLVE